MTFAKSRLALIAPLAAISLSGCGINSIPTAEEAAKAKWANVQADYQRRADLIPNLVATVKGFAKQEKDVLTTVTQARASANQVQLSPGDLTDPAKVAAFQNAQNTLTLATRQLQEAVGAHGEPTIEGMAASLEILPAAKPQSCCRKRLVNRSKARLCHGVCFTSAS